MSARLLRGLLAQAGQWADGFEPGPQSARFWGPTIFTSSAITAALIALMTLVAPLRAFFGLQPAVPLALLGLRVAAYGGFIHHERARGASLQSFAAGAIGMGFLFQLIVSSLVVYSQPPGAFVLAVVPVLGAAYNCIILRATPAFPWPAIGHGLAMALALALHPASPQVEIFSVVAPLGCGAGLLLGSIAEASSQQRRLLAEHRRAIEVEALEQRSGEARQLSSTLLEILQRFHDASSALSTVLLEADLLDGLVKRGGALAAPADAEAARRALREGLRRFGLLLGEREGGRPEDATPSGAVPVLPAVSAAIEQVARRYPATLIALRAVSPHAGRAQVSLRGGTDELEQIVAELLKNACEGSGAERAGQIAVDVEADREPRAVSIRVADDGPGLPAHLLDGHPTALVTTKPGGSGLGLYIIERLLAAAGGSLQLQNAPPHGAQVTVRLACSCAEPEAQPAP